MGQEEHCFPHISEAANHLMTHYKNQQSY